MQTKENTHTHTQQYRKKILPTHTHQNTLSKTYKKPNNNAKNYIQTIYQPPQNIRINKKKGFSLRLTFLFQNQCKSLNGVIAKIDNEKENAYIKTLADKSGKIYSPILNVVLYCYLLYLHYINQKSLYRDYRAYRKRKAWRVNTNERWNLRRWECVWTPYHLRQVSGVKLMIKSITLIISHPGPSSENGIYQLILNQ